MSYVYNILIQLFFFITFSLSITGYGFLLKDKLLKINFNFGEIRILDYFVQTITKLLHRD